MIILYPDWEQNMIKDWNNSTDFFGYSKHQ